MAEPTSSNRLQPTLFDRFMTTERVLTKIDYEKAVKRDLTSLMNTVRLGASEDLSA